MTAEESRRSVFGRKIALRRPFAWSLPLALLLVVGVIFVAIFFSSRSEDFAKVQGIVDYERSLEYVRAPQEGIITRVFFSDGETVESGSVLIRMRHRVSTVTGAAQNSGESLALKAMINRNGEQMEISRANADETLSDLRNQKTQIGREVRALDQQISSSRRIASLLKDDYQRAQEVAERGFVSRRALLDRDLSYMKAEQDLQSFILKRDQLVSELRSLDTRTRQETLRAQAELSRLQQEGDDLSGRLSNVQNRGAFGVQSAQSGTISDLRVHDGSSVASDELLLTIIPENDEARFVMNIPVDSIGTIAIGDDIEVEVSAFPYELFGTVSARILYIADTATITRSQNGEQHYSVLVRAEPLDVDKMMIRQGMTVIARIPQRRTTIIEFLGL